PDLTIEKSDGVDLVSPGETLVYTLTVRNVGNQEATGVVVEETVPSGTTFVSASSTSGWTCVPDNNAGSICTLSLGSLTAGATVTVQFAVAVDDPLTPDILNILNTVTVRDDGQNGADPTPDNNTSTDMDEIGVSAKQLVATNQDFTADPEVAIGEVLTYEISLDVPAGSVQNLVLTDTLDRGLAFIGCDSITADPAVTASAGPLTAICNTASIAAEPAGSTNPADAGRKMTLNFGNVTNTSPEPQTLVVRYRVVVLDVAENVSGVTLNNHAQWTWTGGNVEAEASLVRIIEPRLMVEKTVAPREAMEGQEVTFTITLSRHPDSEGPAHNVVLTDVVPYGLTYVPGSWQFVSGVAPTTLVESGVPTLTATWDVFPANAPATVLQFRARVTNIKPGSSVTNVAQVVWSSLPDYVGAPQSPYNPRSIERSYVPGSVVDVYGASGKASLLVPELELPKTGFAPGLVTQLPAQPADKQYTDQGMTLEIPTLGVKAPIMGVPLTAEGWDLTWLSNQVGYLEGTAFPTWKGNSGLTAHVYGPDGKPGPFVNLGKLKWGDTIIIRYAGQEYRYAVRVVKRVQPDDLSVLGHQERAWLTLITCQGYNQQTNDYASRVVVQAVLIEVK
ncbi:sortase, partial [Anaerolinea sp.]|uniref:sortase n=1 Tax=Anaerolinea sp. TaxID=1872519 RepID=UPI002ACDDC1F